MEVGSGTRHCHCAGRLGARFESLALTRIWAAAIEASTALVRVLQRLGMREMDGGEAAAFLGEFSRYRRFEIHRHHWLTGLDRGTSESPSL